MIWQCNGKFKGEHRCGTPHLKEEDVKRLFLQAVSELADGREALLDTCRMLLDGYLNTKAIDAELAGLESDMEIVAELTKRLIAENAATAMPQDEYNTRYDALAMRFREAEKKADKLKQLKVTRSFQADILVCFMGEIGRMDAALPVEYSDRLWLNLIDRVTVYADRRLVFRFKDGTEIAEKL